MKNRVGGGGKESGSRSSEQVEDKLPLPDVSGQDPSKTKQGEEAPSTPRCVWSEPE